MNGGDIEMDAVPMESQSADCDPSPPPLLKHGSKSNFFNGGGGDGGDPSPRKGSAGSISRVNMGKSSPHPKHR